MTNFNLPDEVEPDKITRQPGWFSARCGQTNHLQRTQSTGIANLFVRLQNKKRSSLKI